MTSFDEFLGPTPGAGTVGGNVLRLATLAYLARYKGDSRMHTESDLRIYLAWCAERHLEPLAVRRAHVEMYVRWPQETRRFRPSTVSRRLSVVAGFYRTCVIDRILEHSPADHVRRPNVPPESPTLGLSHLQFEALLSAARVSVNPNDFALIAMFGLLGLRIFEATGADIDDLGEEHGHRVLWSARAPGSYSYLSHQQSAEPSTTPPANGAPDRSCSIPAGRIGTQPPAAPRPKPSSGCRGCSRSC
jgi:integrase